MSPTAAGLAGLALLFLLLALRTPVAFAMAAVGLLGITVLNGFGPALETFASQAFTLAANAELLVIPLFVLMGNLAAVSGMSRDLYDAAHAWVGHWRGGLASATIIGCAGFAALSGSSVASAVTMGKVALPEMRRHGYDDRLATGTVAAGGTLGILIPPSTGFVIYAILTETSIGKLFLAGVLPGLLLTALFVITIAIRTRLDPALGPAAPRLPWSRRRAPTAKAGPVAVIVVLTVGGLYGGLFTAAEAAAVGALLALALALGRRSLGDERVASVLLDTVKTSAMCFAILIGAHVFGPFLSLSHVAGDLAEFMARQNLGPAALLVILLAVYVVLGMFLEGFAMLVLTIPIVLPMIEKAGVGALLGIADEQQLKIWFGVAMVILLELGLISPPVGVNVFVVKGIAGDVPMRDVFAGIWPFFFAMIVCLVLLALFPSIALVLPNTMLR
jgi:tripartite ATP-independent transporter DctM subunit